MDQNISVTAGAMEVSPMAFRLIRPSSHEPMRLSVLFLTPTNSHQNRCCLVLWQRLCRRSSRGKLQIWIVKSTCKALLFCSEDILTDRIENVIYSCSVHAF